jgi:hypothetical protein
MSNARGEEGAIVGRSRVENAQRACSMFGTFRHEFGERNLLLL